VSSDAVDTSNGKRASFVGGGFGSLLPVVAGTQTPPPPAFSNRGYMREALPGIYQEDEPTMRFVGCFEHVLDPIAALLDALHEHFHPDYAPRPVLDLLAAWLGLEVDEEQDLPARRKAVHMAGDLAKRRGTVPGIELALKLNFPDVPVRVDDEGGVRWSMDGAPAKPGGARFVVYVDTPIPEERQAAIARCIEREKPIETTYRLRVKTSGSTTP
jgi:phage tail-like protein